MFKFCGLFIFVYLLVECILSFFEYMFLFFGGCMPKILLNKYTRLFQIGRIIFFYFFTGFVVLNKCNSSSCEGNVGCNTGCSEKDLGEKFCENIAKNKNIGLINSHIRLLEEVNYYIVDRFKKDVKNNRKNTKKKTQIEAYVEVYFSDKEKNNNKLKDKSFKGCFNSYIKTFIPNVFGYAKEKDFKDSLKQLISEKFGSIVNNKDLDDYVNLIYQMNENEKNFEDYYAFYHGHSVDIGFVFDIQTAIRKYFGLGSFEYFSPYMRFYNTVKQRNILDFMNYYESYGWIDQCSPLQDQVLSVNFVPINNYTYSGSCTFDYFVKGYSMGCSKYILNDLFNELNLNCNYIDKLYNVYKLYMVPEKAGHLLQILIPKDLVDNFVYLAVPGGAPIRDKIDGIDYDTSNMRNKYISQFLDKYINNASSIKMLDRYSGNFSSAPVIDILDKVQGRIVFMPQFYDRASRIKIFRFNFIKPENIKKYKQEVDKIVSDMILEWVNNKNYDKIRQEDIIIAFSRLLKYINA